MLSSLMKSFWFQGALMLLMLPVWMPVSTTQARSTTAPEVPNHHCLTGPWGACVGGNYWPGATYGAYTWIYVKPITCSDCYPYGSSRFDQRLYLSDNAGGIIELGYGVRYGDIYYYYRNRPPGQGEQFYLLDLVPSADRNTDVRFKLSRNLRQWNQVHVNITNRSNTYNWFTVVTNHMGGGNSWLAREVDIMQILTSNASASSNGYIHWRENAWQENNGTYHFQSANGSLFRYPSDSPTFPQWVTLPSQSSTGGWLRISCYCNPH